MAGIKEEGKHPITRLIMMGLDTMASEKEAAGGRVSSSHYDLETSKPGIEQLELIADPDDGLSEEEKAKIVRYSLLEVPCRSADLFRIDAC